MKRQLAVLLAVLALGTVPARAAVPSPAEFLGFEVGADRTLADWTQIAAYFHALDAASPRVLVREVGRTTEGRPFLLVAISSEANMERLEDIRAASLRLADPRGLPEAEAERILETGRVVVAMSYGIHSTEVGTTQASMITAHRLATAEDEETRAIRDQAVVLMLPSHNPDGTQTVTEWYRKSVGTAWEGAAPPFLYQRYTGHDNNRDWYMFTQQETRLTVEHVYRPWPPQIVHDLQIMRLGKEIDYRLGDHRADALDAHDVGQSRLVGSGAKSGVAQRLHGPEMPREVAPGDAADMSYP